MLKRRFYVTLSSLLFCVCKYRLRLLLIPLCLCFIIATCFSQSQNLFHPLKRRELDSLNPMGYKNHFIYASDKHFYWRKYNSTAFIQQRTVMADSCQSDAREIKRSEYWHRRDKPVWIKYLQNIARVYISRKLCTKNLAILKKVMTTGKFIGQQKCLQNS
jgi:hypothetical protein